MCGREIDSTSRPAGDARPEPTHRSAPSHLAEPSSPYDERFVYRLTEEGRRALAAHGRARGGPTHQEAPCTPAVARVLEEEARREGKRQRRKKARDRGARLGTVCGRWRGNHRLPDLRMTGRWLEAAGFALGQEYEVEVEAGKLTILAV